MKIAVNARFLLPNRMEGIGFFTQEVCRRLVARCPEHHFLFYFDRPFSERFIFGSNVAGIVVSPPARHPFLWYTWFEWRLAQELGKQKGAVFFSPDGYCSLSAKAPTVLVCHDIAYLHYPDQIPFLVRQYYQHFVPRYLQRAEQVVTVSQFVKEDILRHYPTTDAQKISVACNGVKTGFAPLSEAEKTAVRQQYTRGQSYFFYLGAVHPRKNVERLIMAYDRYRLLGGQPAQLLLGGRLAWQTSATQAAHRQARYASDIHFLGYVPDAEAPRLLAAAKAFIYPSLSEGFGVPVLEAMHCEVPIISSLSSSLPEVAGDAALLVDPESVEAIAEAMLALDRSSDLGNSLVARGRLQRQQFSWEKATDVVQQALENLND